jgi:hypothetical protein
MNATENPADPLAARVRRLEMWTVGLTLGFALGAAFAALEWTAGTVRLARDWIDGTRQEIRTQSLVVVNERGDPGVVLANEQEHGPRVFLFGRQDFGAGVQGTGSPRIILGVLPDGTAAVQLMRHTDLLRSNTKPQAAASLRLDKNENLHIILWDKTGKGGSMLYLDSNGQPQMTPVDPLRRE